MNFKDKMKAAVGLNFGDVESPDFPGGILIVKEGKLCIIAKALNVNWPDYYVEQSNIEHLTLIGCGGTWAKYYIKFKDGKKAIITQQVLTQSQEPKNGVSVASLERALFLDEPSSWGDGNATRVQPTILAEDSKDQDVKPQPAPEPMVEEKPKVCPNCGSPIDDDMMFCGECGTKLK